MELDLRSLNHEDLVQLIIHTKRLLYPTATIANGEFECSQCHHRGEPSLIEEGIVVTHRIEQLGAGYLVAEGWDGDSSDISDDGERLLLECPECFHWHQLPDDFDVEWT